MSVTLYKETTLGNLCDFPLERVIYLNVPLPAVDSSSLDEYVRGDDLVDQEDYENSYYLAHVAASGGVFTRKRSSCSIRNISWRVLEKTRVIELDVCDAFTDEQNAMFNRIRIQCPMKLRESCIAISEDEQNDRIVIDFITESGFLYTVYFAFDYFKIKSQLPLLNDANASEWRSIKKPNAFDVTKSLLIKSISSSSFVVALSSGNLVALNRETPLDDLFCQVFNEQRNIGFAIASRIFGGADKLDGYPNLSARSSICLEVSPDGLYLMSLAINRAFKIFSLQTLQTIWECTLGPDDFKEVITPQPYNSMVFSVNEDGNPPSATTYLVTCLPSLNSRFKLWIYDGSAQADSILTDLGSSYELDSPVLDDSAIWSVSDFRLIDKKDSLELWVVWKSDTTSITKNYSIPTNGFAPPPNQPWISTDSSVTPNTDYIMYADTNSESESEHYINKIFGPSGYSNTTIATALPIYCKHCGISKEEINSHQAQDRLWLKNKVCQNIGLTVKIEDPNVSIIANQRQTTQAYNSSLTAFQTYRQQLELQWTRFDRLCQELEQQGQDFLAIAYDSRSRMMLSLRASSVKSIRPCTITELYYYNRSESPSKYTAKLLAKLVGREPALVGKLLQLFHCFSAFRQLLTHQVRYNLFLDLRDDFSGKKHKYLTLDRMGLIYDRNLKLFSDTELQGLATVLADIGDLDGFLEIIMEDFGRVPDGGQTFNVVPSLFGSTMIYYTLYQSNCIDRLITLDVIFLCLLSTASNGFVVGLVQMYVKFCHVLKCISATFNAQDTLSLNVAVSELPEEFLRVHKKGTSFFKVLNQLYIKIHGTNGLSRLAVMLYKLGYAEEAVTFSSLYLGHDYVSTLVKAHLFLLTGEATKGMILIEECSIGFAAGDIGNAVLDNELLADLSKVYLTETAFGAGFIDYYLSHAKICFEMGLYTESLKLASLASQHLDSNDKEKKIRVFELLFQAAVHSEDYEEAYNGIMELVYAQQTSEKLGESILALAKEMTLSSKGQRFCQYPFIGITREVEQILENYLDTVEMSSDPVLVKAFYQLLYCWRYERGDYRGAATVVYKQVQATKETLAVEESSLEELLELYAQVLNTMEFIGKGQAEQWILFKSKNKPRGVKFYKDVEREKSEVVEVAP